MGGIDWGELFGLQMPVSEIIVRGTAIYWFLFAIFRFVIRRDVGSVGIADVVILVIVADAAQNGMSGDYKTITEGAILISTLVFWNAALDWMCYRFPAIRRFAEAPPLRLVKDGRMIHRNMKRELITEDELWSLLRAREVRELSEVEEAYLEPNGDFSVIKRQS